MLKTLMGLYYLVGVPVMTVAWWRLGAGPPPETKFPAEWVEMCDFAVKPLGTGLEDVDEEWTE